MVCFQRQNSGLPSVSDAIVERVRVCIQPSPQKSTCLVSLAFQPSKTNASKVHVSVYLQLYKDQLVQALQPEDVAVRHEFKRTKRSQGGRYHQVWPNTIYSTTITEPTQTAPNMDRKHTINMELSKTKGKYHTS